MPCFSSECNVGVVKKRWVILILPPHFNMDIQAHIPPALAATHNFIMKHDPTDIDDYDVGPDPNPGFIPDRDPRELADGATTHAEKARAEFKQDEIAQAMWESYQALALILERGEDGLE